MFEVLFDEFCDMLIPLGSLNSPAELHGFLCGKLCGGARLGSDECLDQSWKLLDVVETPDATANDLVLNLYEATLSALDSSDYSLQLLLPDDETEIAVRVQALGQWVQGFLVGFGAAGIDPDKTFSSDSAEALRDLAQIAQVSSADPDDVVEDDDQEADYVELSEYVRVVALTFYTEHNAMSTEKSAQNLH